MTVRWGQRQVSITVRASGGRCADDCGWCTPSCADGSDGGSTRVCFAHRFVFHTDEEEISTITVPFLRCGFGNDDALLAVSDDANIELLRDALGDNHQLVDDAAAIDRYCQPARTLVPGSRTPTLSHPETLEPTAGNHDPDLPEPPDSAHVLCFGQHDLSKLRHLVAERAHRSGIKAQQTAELVFLVHEIAFSVVEHSGGDAALRIWQTGDHLSCQVTSPVVSSGGPFSDCTRAANHLLGGVRMWRLRPARRHARRPSRAAAVWPLSPRRGSDGGCRNARAGWDLPG